MKHTIKLTSEQQMVGYLVNLGTECRFVSMVTETAVDMRKTGNPYLGAVKVAKRNGLVNVNYTESVRRKLSAKNGTPISETVVVPGKTWYTHITTDDGKPMALCQHAKDASKWYLQYFPHRNLGTKYFLNGVEMTPEQIQDMQRFIPTPKKSDTKPLVITLAISSIKEIKFRKMTIRNETDLNRLSGKTVKLDPAPELVTV